MFSGLRILRQHFAAYNYAALPFLVLVVLMIHHTCSAINLNQRYHPCSPSSCGNIRNISYPFRLKTDPENCGNKKYELACENNRAVVQYLDNTTAKYYVQAINYNNFTIRLADASVDKDNCSSIPHHSLSYYNVYGYYYDVMWQLIFVSCANPVSSPLYVNTSPCNENGTYNNSSTSSPSHLNAYSYVMVDNITYVGSLSFGNLMDSCHIDVVVPVMPWPLENLTNLSLVSYKQVHDRMLYGFELSWRYACCEFAQENRCNLNATELSTYCPAFEESSAGNPIPEFLKGLLRHLVGKDDHIPELNIKVYLYSNSPADVRKPWRVELTVYWMESLRQVLDIDDIGVRTYLELEIYTGPDTFMTRKIQSLNLVLLITLVVFIVLFRVALFFCGILCLIPLLIYKWRRRHLSMYDMIEEFLQSHDNPLMPVRYSYSEIKKITNGFKDKLGEGGFGSVYKGKLRSGRFAAIKMLSKSKANGQDFMNEVATIGRIHHVNVVQLIGFCAEGSKRALVYEFMANGSLDKYIFSREGSNIIIPLSNKKMYEISLGVARGIEYLHQGCDMQILHFDIKPHNILLVKL